MPATMARPLARVEDASVVSRPRLVARLLEGSHVPLVLIVAPAGFGKTTLLSQWEERDARSFVRVAPDDLMAFPVSELGQPDRARGRRRPPRP